jgi:hypothetical protein
MPVKVKKTGKCYKVTTPHGTKAKCTSKKKAEAQKRIIGEATAHEKMRDRVMGS